MTTKASLGVVDPSVLDRANHTGTYSLDTSTGTQTVEEAIDQRAPSYPGFGAVIDTTSMPTNSILFVGGFPYEWDGASIIPVDEVNINAFGQVGSGVDDFAIFEEAIILAAAQKKWLNLNGLEINLGANSGEFSFTSSDEVKVRNGTIRANEFYPMNIKGTDVALGSVTTPALYGYQDITFSLSSGSVSPGDVIEILSDKLWYHDPRDETYKSEISWARAINGSTLSLAHALNDTYEASETLSLRAISAPKVRIQSVVFKNESAGDFAFGLRLDGCKDVYIQDAESQDGKATGFSFRDSVGVIAYNIRSFRSNALTTGYGCQIFSCTDVTVDAAEFTFCRRAVDVSGIGAVSRNVNIINSVATGGGVQSDGQAYFNAEAYEAGDPYISNNGFGTHGPCEGVVFDNCTTRNIDRAYVLRGRNISLINSQHYGLSGYFLDMQHGGGGRISGNRHLVTAEGNAEKSKPVNYDFAPEKFMRIVSNWDVQNKLIIENNYCDALRIGFVDLFGDFANVVFNLSIRNNEYRIVRNSLPSDVFYQLMNNSTSYANTSGYIENEGNRVNRDPSFTGSVDFSDAAFESGFQGYRKSDKMSVYSRFISDDEALKIPVINTRTGRLKVSLMASSTATGQNRWFDGWLRINDATAPVIGSSSVAPQAIELNGTTGPDASINISYIPGFVCVENRIGVSLYFDVEISGGG